MVDSALPSKKEGKILFTPLAINHYDPPEFFCSSKECRNMVGVWVCDLQLQSIYAPVASRGLVGACTTMHAMSPSLRGLLLVPSVYHQESNRMLCRWLQGGPLHNTN